MPVLSRLPDPELDSTLLLPKLSLDPDALRLPLTDPDTLRLPLGPDELWLSLSEKDGLRLPLSESSEPDPLGLPADFVLLFLGSPFRLALDPTLSPLGELPFR